MVYYKESIYGKYERFLTAPLNRAHVKPSENPLLPPSGAHSHKHVMNSVRGSSVCGQPSEFGLLCCHGTTATGFLFIEETRVRQTARKRETRGNRSSSQLRVKEMSIKHIIYTERYQTDKRSYVFHPIAIPATSFKK